MIEVGDQVSVFGMAGIVVGIEEGLYQIELRNGPDIDAVVWAPLKDVQK